MTENGGRRKVSKRRAIVTQLVNRSATADFRRFFNVTEGEPGVEHVLLFVVAGNAPEAAYTPEATKRINEYHDGVGAVSHRGVQRKLLRPVGD